MKARLRQCRKEQVRPRQAPDDLSIRPCRNPGNKQGDSRTVDDTRPTPGKLVQRAIGKAPAWKNGVDLRNSKRQIVCFTPGIPLQCSDAGTKIRYDVLTRSRHYSLNPFGSWMENTT